MTHFSFDGKKVKPEFESISTVGHTAAGNNLGKWKSLPFVTGGYDTELGYHAQTEVIEFDSTGTDPMDMTGKYKWTTQAKYPYHKS